MADPIIDLDSAETKLEKILSLVAAGTEVILARGDLVAHHRDPFDRMLIAQACVEGMTLVTGDPMFVQYEASILW